MKQDLIISYADIVYSAEIVRALIESQEPLSIVVDKNWRTLWEKRFENPLLDAETLKIREGKVIELGKKPKWRLMAVGARLILRVIWRL